MTTKLTKKHLGLILDEARRQFIELPSPVYLFGDEDKIKNFSDGERMAYCYLQATLLLFNSNKLLVDNWQEEFQINLTTEDSEPDTED